MLLLVPNPDWLGVGFRARAQSKTTFKHDLLEFMHPISELKELVSLARLAVLSRLNLKQSIPFLCPETQLPPPKSYR